MDVRGRGPEGDFFQIICEADIGPRLLRRTFFARNGCSPHDHHGKVGSHASLTVGRTLGNGRQSVSGGWFDGASHSPEMVDPHEPLSC